MHFLSFYKKNQNKQAKKSEKKQKNSNKSFFSSLELSRKQYHHHLGNVAIYRSDQNKLILIYQANIDNNEEYEAIVKKISLRHKRYNKYLVNQLYQNCYIDSGQQTSSFHITVGLNFYERTLDQELILKRKMKNHFSESELWHIMIGQASALKTLLNDDISHGDLHPETVYITPENIIKLMDFTVLGYKSSGYYKMMISDVYKSALSPKLQECQ